MDMVNDADFQSAVLESTLPVVADFSATWCGPCRMLEPTLKALASENEGKVKFVKVDIDQAPGVAGRFGVTNVPTLILFKAGQEAARKVGAAPKPALSSWIAENA